MALCTKVGLGPGHIVLHGDPAPPPIGGTAPKKFGPCLLWPNGRPSQLLLSTCPLAYENVHSSIAYHMPKWLGLYSWDTSGPLVRIVNPGISESQRVYLRTRYYNFVVVLCGGRQSSQRPNHQTTSHPVNSLEAANFRM